jgi:hypothetical protein
MIRKVPEPEDPLQIVGVVLDRPMDAAEIESMARTFVEEYALMGWGPRRILSLFRHPHFAGAHEAYRVLGEARIVSIVSEVAGAQEVADA